MPCQKILTPPGGHSARLNCTLIWVSRESRYSGNKTRRSKPRKNQKSPQQNENNNHNNKNNIDNLGRQTSTLVDRPLPKREKSPLHASRYCRVHPCCYLQLIGAFHDCRILVFTSQRSVEQPRIFLSALLLPSHIEFLAINRALKPFVKHQMRSSQEVQ